MNRIKYIDGLRGIAVMMVLFFHINCYKNGFAGVEIFFVISGFIITTLLLAEYKKTETIDLKSFYIRRVSRIYPPLIVVVLISIFLFTNFPIDSLSNRFSQEALYTSFGSTNWYEVIHTTGYWENGVKSPLLHLWSIAIEMQFYLFWPLILKITMRFEKSKQRNILALFIGVLAFFFFALTLIESYHYDFNILYYSSQTRVISFIIGGLFAAISFRFKNKDALKKWSPFLSILLLSGAIASTFFFRLNALLLFRGEILIFTIFCGAFIFILGNINPSHFLRKIFENRIILYLGKISYSFYLWHIPIIVFVSQKNIQLLTKMSITSDLGLIFIQILLSFVFAIFSNLLIEQRIHIKKAIPALIVIFIFPLITAVSLNPTISQHFKVVNDQPDVPQIWQGSKPIITEGESPLMIVGDSWSRRLAFGLDLAQQTENKHPYQLLLYGNGNASLMDPDYFLNSSGEKAFPFKNFEGYLEYWTTAINRYHPKDVLIVTGNADQSEMVIGGVRIRVGSKDFEKRYIEQFNKLTHFFNQRGIKIYLTNIPNNAHSLADLSLNKTSTAMNHLFNESVKQLDVDVTVLDLKGLLANGSKQISPKLIDTTFMYDESNHPSHDGSLYIGNWLLKEIQAHDKF